MANSESIQHLGAENQAVPMKSLVLSKLPFIKLIFGACAVKKCNAEVTAVINSNSSLANSQCGIIGNDDLKELYLCEKHYQEVKAIAIANNLNFEEE